eukprot:183223-Chlamydomonas_euryale.AAC.1
MAVGNGMRKWGASRRCLQHVRRVCAAPGGVQDWRRVRAAPGGGARLEARAWGARGAQDWRR